VNSSSLIREFVQLLLDEALLPNGEEPRELVLARELAEARLRLLLQLLRVLDMVLVILILSLLNELAVLELSSLRN